MKRPRASLPVRRRSHYAGRPRVVNDHELYAVLAEMAQTERGGPVATVQEMGEYVRLWFTPYEDWQVQVIACRARIFLGSVRKELGRRMKLDPNQLSLLEGINQDGKDERPTG